jgi:Cu2+-exporting ATPase
MVAALFDPPSSPTARNHKRPCAHCGSPCPPQRATTEGSPCFCCPGCEFVYQLIHSRGLERFYNLQQVPQSPVSPGVFQRRDLEWFVSLCRDSPGRVHVEIAGVSCIGCVWLIERCFLATAGSIGIRVDPVLGTAELKFLTATFPAQKFAEELQQLGYLLGRHSENATAPASRTLTVRLGVCAALAMNAMLFSVPAYCGLESADRFAALFERGALVCATLSLLVGGSYFVRRAWQALCLGVIHVDLPIALGLIAAYAGSLTAWKTGHRSGLYLDFVSIFTFLMLVGRWTQQRAIEHNKRLLLQSPLTLARPKLGARYTLTPDQVVPVRSILHSCPASFGMEWINGEPDARPIQTGQTVPSGAINLHPERIDLEALENWEDSLLSRLVALPAIEPQKDPAVQRFILGYLLAVVLVGAGGFTAKLASGADWFSALQVAISVLVVSCPCASGVALPLLDELAAARMRSRGVFVRSHSLWRRLLRVRRLVFDKTGTLTTETPQLQNPDVLHTLPDDARYALEHLVERSLHPIATSLRAALGASRQNTSRPTHAPPLEAREFTGLGLEWNSPEGDFWRLGLGRWATPIPDSPENAQATVLSKNGLAVATFGYAETPRPDASAELTALRARGMDLHILSGDHPARVATLAKRVGIPPNAAHGGRTPDQKAQWLHNRAAARDTLMLGDGANDSLAFNESLCCGTPAVDRGVLENKCDFYYLGQGLGGIRALLETAARKQHVTRTVLVFTGLYNAGAIAIAWSGHMHPLLAAILMPLSSLATLALVLGRF